MTYGSATTARDVPDFLTHVYRITPPASVINEFKRRFDLIRSSPLVEITTAQAHALELELKKRCGQNAYIVKAGMLHSAPYIDNAVINLAQAGCTKVIGLLLSPQYSSIIMSGYEQALAHAAAEAGIKDYQVIGPWPNQPKFIQLLSERLVSSRAELAARYAGPVPIIFSTHSLPKSVVKRDPGYLQQLRQTIAAIVRKAGLDDDDWVAAYQSAGHTPEEWLKPDLQDVLNTLSAQEVPAVLVVPIQFLSDHLEVLYDLDIAAAEQASNANIGYHRIELPNVDLLFIKALADLVINNHLKIVS